MADGPRDALVSRNSATTKHPIWKLEFQVYRMAFIIYYISRTRSTKKIERKTEGQNRQNVCSYVSPFSYNTGVWQTHTDKQTDGQTHDDGMYRA